MIGGEKMEFIVEELEWRRDKIDRVADGWILWKLLCEYT